MVQATGRRHRPQPEGNSWLSTLSYGVLISWLRGKDSRNEHSIWNRYDDFGARQPHGDLIQEGNVGLMKAVKRFDPDQGVRLVSYAMHWIKAEIHEYILKNWRMVKVATTKAQRKLFFNLRSMKQGFKADASAADAAT